MMPNQKPFGLFHIVFCGNPIRVPVFFVTESRHFAAAVCVIRQQFNIYPVPKLVPKLGNGVIMVFPHIDTVYHDAAQNRFGSQRVGIQKILYDFLVGHACIFPVSFVVSVLKIPKKAVRKPNRIADISESKYPLVSTAVLIPFSLQLFNSAKASSG